MAPAEDPEPAPPVGDGTGTSPKTPAAPAAPAAPEEPAAPAAPAAPEEPAAPVASAAPEEPVAPVASAAPGDAPAADEGSAASEGVGTPEGEEGLRPTPEVKNEMQELTERQEVPKELKNTGQQLTTALEEIQDSQTPQNLKKQLSTLVEQVTDTLQVISDPKTPPKERAALTKVVRQVTDTLQVISDPKTPPKERAALTKVVRQVSDTLQVISDPQTSPKERAKAKKTLKQLNKQLTKHLKGLHEHPKTDEADKGHPKTDEADKGHPKTDEPDKGTEPQTQRDCEKANRPWVESSGYCGKFGTITGPKEDPSEQPEFNPSPVYTQALKCVGSIVIPAGKLPETLDKAYEVSKWIGTGAAYVNAAQGGDVKTMIWEVGEAVPGLPGQVFTCARIIDVYVDEQGKEAVAPYEKDASRLGITEDSPVKTPRDPALEQKDGAYGLHP
ncbi:hypothetical protein [Streptomyces swartbergensis]|uniref:hypothetical protein n=1 Tax=Streptomyces swartbergensis TaxID=487165 RepID=UPI00381FE176